MVVSLFCGEAMYASGGRAPGLPELYYTVTSTIKLHQHGRYDEELCRVRNQEQKPLLGLGFLP